MPRPLHASLACAIALSVLAAPAVASPAVPVSGHATLSLERPEVTAAAKARRALRPPAVRQQTLAIGGPGPIVEREVYGYLPYWEMDYDFPHWELLSTVAWFAVGMDSNGDADDWNGWGGDATETVVQEVQANGVLATLTITNFSDSSIGTLVNDPSRRANAIETCLMLMAVHGADGINIDFEFVPASGKQGFVTFMTDLKDAVADVAPNGHEGHVTLAGPAVDWGGAYDYDQLLIHTDGIMIMAYGYHWQGGDPGPISPLYGGGKWGKYSVEWTVNDYLTYGGVENRHKIIVGLPFYGRSWPVGSEAIPGDALDSGSAITFDVAAPEAEQYGAGWDDDAKNPYYHKTTGGQLEQVWYDDQQSFGLKLAYVAEQDLGGIGIWALGYAGTREEYWQEIADHLGADVEDPPVVEDPDPPDVEDPPEEPEDPPEETEDPPVSEDPVDEVEDPVDEVEDPDEPVEEPGPVGNEEDPPGAEPDSVLEEPEPTGPVAMPIKSSTHTRETITEGCGAAGPTGGAQALALALLAWLLVRRRRAA